MNAINATVTPITSAIGQQMALLEQPVEKVFCAGSIKGAMKKMNNGVQGKSRDLWQVAPSKLRVVENLNPRVETPKYMAHIRDLADSMLEHGFFQDKPLAGFVTKEDGEDVTYIVEGGTRLRAALIAIEEGAKFTEVPVSVDQAGLNMEDVLVRMVRGNTGLGLTQYETALIVKRLAKFSWENSKIAAQLGLTPAQVTDSLTLMGADQRIRELVASELMAFTFAVEMINTYHEKAFEHIEKAQEKAAASGKTRITSRHVVGASYKKELTKAAAPMLDLLALIKSDGGYDGLCDIVKAKLDALLETMAAHKAADAPVETAAANVETLKAA